MNLNKDEWQIGFDDGSGKGKNSGLNEGIFIRVKGGGGGTPSIVTGDTNDYGIPIGILDPAVANVIGMVPPDVSCIQGTAESGAAGTR